MSTVITEPAVHLLAEAQSQSAAMAPPLPDQETGTETGPTNQAPARRPDLLERPAGQAPSPATDRRSAAEAEIHLAEENQRLSAENRRLRGEQRRRETVLFLSELRDDGKLTPAMELAGIEELLLAAVEKALDINFPDGSVKPLGDVLKAVLAALPKVLSLSELAPAPRHPRAVELTADEQDIARALGLTAEEYVEIKSSS